MAILQLTTARKDVFIVQKHNATGADVNRTKEGRCISYVSWRRTAPTYEIASRLLHWSSLELLISPPTRIGLRTWSSSPACYVFYSQSSKAIRLLLPDSFMHSSPMNSALVNVHRRLQGPWGRFVPPPAYSAYPVQTASLHGTPMTWTPPLYTQGNSTQATFPAVKGIPPSTWTTLNQPGTPFVALPNTNTPVQLQNSWQNSPLAQATVQPTSSWARTDAIPHVLKNIPQTPSSSLHTPSKGLVTISTLIRSLLPRLIILLYCY